MKPLPVRILGVGLAVPERIVPSSFFDARFGFEPGYTESKTGVAERRFAHPGQTATDLGVCAAQNALSNAGIDARELDLIVNASGSAVQMIPDGAALLQKGMGLGDSGIPCLSIHTTCLSFLSALELIATAIVAGNYRHVLVVSAEVTSGSVAPDDWHSSSLFGDGAAAVVLAPSTRSDHGVIHGIHSETYGSAAELARYEGGGTKNAPHLEHSRPDMYYFHMDGLGLYRAAKRVVPAFFARLFERSATSEDTIDWIVPHQASSATGRILRHCGFAVDKAVMVLRDFGNCVAASIPMALQIGISSGRIQRGQRLLLCGTGAGFSVKGLIMTF